MAVSIGGLTGATAVLHARSRALANAAVRSGLTLPLAGLRWPAMCGLLCAAVTVALSLAAVCPAADPEPESDEAAVAELTGMQQMLELPVRIVDAEDEPIAGAKLNPWALQSSQGHGFWRKDDQRAGVGPEAVTTGDDGTAAVLYPYYRDADERTRTTSVSLKVDHPEFVFISRLHIDVPLEDTSPYEIQLTRGVPVEIRPTIDGDLAETDGLFTLWSDGRCWQPGAAAEENADGTLRIPASRPGANSVLLVKLDGERATHFSEIHEFELAAGNKVIELPVRRALRIEGVLSDNVPRPVRNGRIKVETLPPADAETDRVGWFTWTPIRPDGTFTIDGWPDDERLQLIALCDGYIAASGAAPDEVENPRPPENDPHERPQVFDPTERERIEVTMTPLVPCVVTVVDGDDEAIAGVTVASWPNVGWWNTGSQVYGHPLVRGERGVRQRGDYDQAIDEAFAPPFQGETDAHGQVTLELPVGSERLTVISDVYEMPVFLGRRYADVELEAGERTEVTLRLQPRGTERLGEWDKLAGVVFGCSTREGRRICALPGVREKMDQFAKRFREAKNRRDPQLLSEAYATVADAFLGVGDHEEAAKWRRKAADQAAKVDDGEPAVGEPSAAGDEEGG